MKKLVKLSLVFLLVLNIFACAKLPKIKLPKFNIKVDVKISSTSVVDTGDKLELLEGDVFTLSPYELPRIGDKLYGFKVTGIYDYKGKNAKVVRFEHIKTGAVVMLISNDDEDKLACMGFKTVVTNDKGIPHIFEHATLNGSEKYQSANAFFETANKTYNTFLNAFTFQTYTAYPVASLSDEQLFSLYKYYLDAVLYPNVLKNKKLLDREGYRYELFDKNDDININGIVYSEMSANEGSIERAQYFNSMKTAFPNSYLSCDSGGTTEAIPTLTHEEIIKFHDKYYHPSNMLMTLYGNLDYKRYLKYADEEYFSKSDRIVNDFKEKEFTKNTEFIEKDYEFPAPSGSSVDNEGKYSYLVSLDDISQYEAGYFSLVVRTLEKEDGPLNKRVLERLPKASYVAYFNAMDDIPNLYIEFSNINKDDKETLKNIVDESIIEIVEKGIDKDVIEDVMNDIELSDEFENDSHGFSDYIGEYYGSCFNDSEELGYFKFRKGYNDIRIRYEDGSLKKLIDKYFTTENNRSATYTEPVPGLLETNNEKKIDKLKDKKANMTDDEVNALIKESNDFVAWTEESKKESIIDKIRVASVSSLDEYKAKCYAYEENKQGIRFIRSDIEDIKYSDVSLLFDTSGVKYEDTLKLSLLSDLLLYLPTENYPNQDLSAALSKVTSSFGAYTNTNIYYKGGFKPYFEFHFITLDRNLQKTIELMKELMFKTKFEDTAKLKECAQNAYVRAKESINSEPSNYANTMLFAKMQKDYLYDLHISGLDYTNFLKEITEMNDDELRKLLSECKELLNSIYNRNGEVCQIISNFDTMKTIKAEILSLSENFKDERIEEVNYFENLKPLDNKTALVVSGNVNYNYIGTSLFYDKDKYSAKADVFNALIDDKFLYQEFRVKRACYGAYSSSGNTGHLLFTYRDPNIKETYKVYEELIPFLKNVKMSKDEFEDYKLRAYSRFSYPLTKHDAASIAINEIFNKCDESRSKRYVRYMQEVKATLETDIDEYIKEHEKLFEDKLYTTAGSKEAIENNKDMFDKIYYDIVE